MEKIATRSLYTRLAEKSRSSKAVGWLFLTIFLEIVLFIPMDAVLALFCSENSSNKRYLYLAIATLASVLGALLGYFLGLWAWEVLEPYVLGKLISHRFFDQLCLHYQKWQHAAVFIGSLLPFPFKAITVSAGVCSLEWKGFVLSIFTSRLLRFSLVVKMSKIWGEQLRLFAQRYFGKILLALLVKIVAVFLFFWFLGNA